MKILKDQIQQEVFNPTTQKPVFYNQNSCFNFGVVVSDLIQDHEDINKGDVEESNVTININWNA